MVNDTTEPVSAQDGINVMQIIEAAVQSNNQRKVVDL
jgi:scyllo-inositol 2-dehydrogenase (NADP+)